MMGNVRQPNRRKRIAKARNLGREMTEPERRLWWKLRRIRCGDSHFRRQAPVGPYFADFACHQIRLAIEIDGDTHASANAVYRDEVRSNYFLSHGYRVLRFLNNDVMSEIEGVMTVIQQAIGEPVEIDPPPLTPPLALRGRGKA
jgi:very-short-patch-repair endonuclease